MTSESYGRRRGRRRRGGTDHGDSAIDSVADPVWAGMPTSGWSLDAGYQPGPGAGADARGALERGGLGSRDRLVAVAAAATLVVGAGVAGWRWLDGGDRTWSAQAQARLQAVSEQTTQLTRASLQWDAQPATVRSRRADVQAHLRERVSELNAERARLAAAVLAYQQLPGLRSRQSADEERLRTLRSGPVAPGAELAAAVDQERRDSVAVASAAGAVAAANAAEATYADDSVATERVLDLVRQAITTAPPLDPEADNIPEPGSGVNGAGAEVLAAPAPGSPPAIPVPAPTVAPMAPPVLPGSAAPVAAPTGPIVVVPNAPPVPASGAAPRELAGPIQAPPPQVHLLAPPPPPASPPRRVAPPPAVPHPSHPGPALSDPVAHPDLTREAPDRPSHERADTPPAEQRPTTPPQILAAPPQILAAPPQTTSQAPTAGESAAPVMLIPAPVNADRQAVSPPVPRSEAPPQAPRSRAPAQPRGYDPAAATTPPPASYPATPPSSLPRQSSPQVLAAPEPDTYSSSRRDDSAASSKDASSSLPSEQQVHEYSGSRWVAKESQTSQGQALMRELFGGGEASAHDDGSIRRDSADGSSDESTARRSKDHSPARTASASANHREGSDSKRSPRLHSNDRDTSDSAGWDFGTSSSSHSRHDDPDADSRRSHGSHDDSSSDSRSRWDSDSDSHRSRDSDSDSDADSDSHANSDGDD